MIDSFNCSVHALVVMAEPTVKNNINTNSFISEISSDKE